LFHKLLLILIITHLGGEFPAKTVPKRCLAPFGGAAEKNGAWHQFGEQLPKMVPGTNFEERLPKTVPGTIFFQKKFIFGQAPRICEPYIADAF